MKKQTPLQKAKAEVKQLKNEYNLSIRYANETVSELNVVKRELEIEKLRTKRREQALKNINDITSGLYNAHATDNKVVVFELVSSVSRIARSEISFLPETNTANG